MGLIKRGVLIEKGVLFLKEQPVPFEAHEEILPEIPQIEIPEGLVEEAAGASSSQTSAKSFAGAAVWLTNLKEL